MFQLNNINKNKPVCIGAIPLLAVEIDRPPMQRAFCFMKHQEIWKPVVGYEGLYEVSFFGDLRSVKSQMLISQQTINSGYKTVHLSKNNKRKAFTVHRLVAQAFIPNPEGKPQVNHINADKKDNRVENLEWCTASENIKNIFKNGGGYNIRESSAKRMKHIGTKFAKQNGDRLRELNKLISKPIYKCDLNGDIIKEYPSIKQAQRENKLHNISAALKGKIKTSGGFIWKLKF